MAQKELVFKLKYLSEGGEIVEKQATTFNEIKQSVADLQKELENTDLGSEQFQNLQNELKKSEGALASAKDSTTSLMDSFTSLPGPIGGVIQGAKALNASLMKLVLNPIGAIITAIVLALTALYKAFTSTKAGAEQLDRIFAGVSAAMDVLRDRVLKVGEALVKFFSGDFSGALESAKESVSGIGEEIASEFKQAMDLKKELQAIDDASRDLNKTRAEQNKLIASAKLVINDETKSYDERKKALEEVRKAEIALAKQEEQLALRRYEAIKAQNALSDSSKEALDEEAQAYITLQNAQQQSLLKQKELFDQEKALRDRQRAEQKAAADKRKQELQAVADLEQQLNLALIQDEKEKAEMSLQIQREKDIQQIQELNISGQRKRDLILKVEAKTELERQKLQKESYTKQLEAFNAYRQFLIQQELVNQDALIQVSEETTNKLLKDYEDLFFNQTLDREQFILEQVNLAQKEEYTLQTTLKAYDRYYETLKFQAEQSYLADIADTKRRQEERQKQIRDAGEFAKQQNAIAKKELDDKKITEEQYRTITEKSLTDFNTRINQINDYFRDYEKNRTLQFEAEKTKITQQQTERRSQIEKRFIDFKKRIQDELQKAEDARVQLAIDAFETTSDLVGRETELGKKLAQASVLIQTWQNASAAVASQLAIKTPDAPIRAAIAAGIQVAQGLFRVAQIQKVEVPKAATGGLITGQGSGTMDNIPVMVSNGESVINAQSTQAFGPLLSLINQLGGGASFDERGVTSSQVRTPQSQLASIMGGDTPPIKAYVVSQDISSQQELDRRIQQRSTL